MLLKIKSYKFHVLLNKIKLIIILFLIILLLPFSLWLINKLLSSLNATLHLPCYILFILAYSPIIFLILCLIKNGGFNNITGKLTDIKYYKYFPILFYYDPKPKIYKFHDVEKIKNILLPGDILLQRQNTLLDTLILGQTSYFTHSAIYYGEYKNKKHTVFQAIGKKGVSPIGLKAFSKCDEILILRFNADLPINNSKTPINPENGAIPYFLNVTEPELQNLENSFNYLRRNRNLSLKNDSSILDNAVSQLEEDENNNDNYNCPKSDDYNGGSVWGKIVYVKDAKKFICDEINNIEPAVSIIGKEEMALYWRLVNDIMSKKSYNINFTQYLKVIKEIALMEKHVPYDYNFNFVNSKYLSCVEYVWYCYKCLLPVHNVRRETLYYFNWIKTYVTVPDTFINSNFFNVIFTSINSDKIQTELSKKDINYHKIREDFNDFRKRYLNIFWYFILKIIFWEIAILIILSFLKNPLRYIFHRVLMV